MRRRCTSTSLRRPRHRSLEYHGVVNCALGWACYAVALYKDDSATLDDLREAVATLAEIEPTARRVFGSAYPTTEGIADEFRYAREALRARETPSPSPSESS